MVERLISERLAELAAQVGGTPRMEKHGDLFVLEVTASDGEHFSTEVDPLDETDDGIAVLHAQLAESGWTVGDLPAREEQRRHEYRLTYEGGAQVTIKAHDAGEAVRLAGRGKPEQIADLTEAEAFLPGTEGGGRW